MNASDDIPPVAVIGAGAVGSSLAVALAEQGYHVEAVLSRTRASARALARKVDAATVGTVEAGLPTEVRLVYVCVPDEAIPTVAGTLAATDHAWGDTIVAHVSGAQTAAVLAPLSDVGAATMSFHPLQTFVPGTGPEAFEEAVVGIEGDDRAVAAGTTVAYALDARPVSLTAEQKTRYHAAAALASNGLVALMAVVEEVFPDAAQEEAEDAVTVMAPLLEQTWANLQRDCPEKVLTGPVARGDEATVEAHLDALSKAVPHLIPLYTAISTEMVRTALRGGKLDREGARSLLETLRTAADGVVEGEEPPDPSL